MTLVNFKRMLAVAILSGIATGVFAEEGAAPVYDVDNYPPQFDGTPENSGEAAGSSALQQNLQPQVQSSAASPAAEAIAPEEPSVPAPRSSLSMEQRMRRLEQQVNNAQQSTSSAKIEALQGQVQTLRGQVEELTHQLQQMQSQQRAMFTDIDKRLSGKAGSTAAVTNDGDVDQQPVIPVEKAIKTSSLVKTPVSGVPVKAPVKSPAVSSSAVPLDKTPVADSAKSAPETQPNVAEEQQIYQTAYDLIKAKKYNDAVATLQKMLQKYPSGQFAANAHYWLGELYGLLNKNDLSVKEFSTVVTDYPDSPKVADAQLKVGLIYAGQFKWTEAKAAFKKVINRYPGSASARLASEQLKQIKLAGH